MGNRCGCPYSFAVQPPSQRGLEPHFFSFTAFVVKRYLWAELRNHDAYVTHWTQFLEAIITNRTNQDHGTKLPPETSHSCMPETHITESTLDVWAFPSYPSYQTKSVGQAWCYFWDKGFFIGAVFTSEHELVSVSWGKKVMGTCCRRKCSEILVQLWNKKESSSWQNYWSNRTRCS